MILPGQRLPIVIALKPVDFRRGHDGLAATVQNELGLDPHSGLTVVFRSKRGDRVKVSVWDAEPDQGSVRGTDPPAKGLVAQEADGTALPKTLPSASAPRRRSRALPKGLPREERVIAPDDLAYCCRCGKMVVIGEDRSERLDVRPVNFRVLVSIRPRYVCPKGHAGIRQAPAPPTLIGGGIPTEATIAHVIVAV